MAWRAVACAVLLGCGEHAVPSSGPDAGASDVAFACDDSMPAQAGELRRLTMTQYRNTVRDLTRWALGDAGEADIVIGLAGLDALPIDRRERATGEHQGGYRRLDQALEQSHVDATLRVAQALARALTTPERLATIAGACAVDHDAANDEACALSFIQRFGARALRRPLDGDDEQFYRVVFGNDGAAGAAGYRDVISVLLSSPELSYFVEHATTEVPGRPGRYALSAHELASRLSYHFWQTLPDEPLWQAAEDGSLLEPTVLASEIERLLSDPRARDTMAELFSDWLSLEDVPELDAFARDPAFAAFAGDDLPSPALREHTIAEALDMLAYYTWTEPAGIDALFTSERSFARAEELAQLYGAPPWDGAAPPPELPPGERPGLLSRAWLLANGAVTTRPIQRGVRIRRALLCDELAPPPVNVSALLPATLEGETTRQAVEELTEQPGTACASCHATLINPLGFAFEGFDALARTRTQEALFASDGARTAVSTVDTRSVPRITPDDLRASSGPAEVIELMLDSGKLEACLARNYFRFTFGRTEDLTRDGCALERLRTRLTGTGRLRDLLEEAALLPELRERSFDP